ncbi:RNA recognition motif domain-containing protein [Tautonia plasticadhaerens]|uniref:RNA recognition motif (RRM, RBD, or RNP domain) n=1 Tax=Tautonia plasticadhaerens TaxID=2527974 RepID=A0A518H874_9BACT|nr:RNA-binding protein [Tautonia plasticadhaerens]QDV37053.1 RNA recognition motif (RRM, RBD, or RNP domain) [Tautonia plasticadhaerens]
MRIYVGNLSYSVTSEMLRSMFEPFGTVDWAEVQTKMRTGRSRGFGLVDMPDDDQARAAVEALDGSEVEGRVLSVNESRPRRSVRDLYAGGWSASARR